jgi:hypothetical protein
MAYDAADKYVVLFGGANGTHGYSDTWKFSAGKWTKLTVPTHPSARFEAGMSYDAADGGVVMFGGFTPALVTLGDTWVFKAGVWTSLSVAHPPMARGFASMATDGPTAGALLFGGFNYSIGSLGDTWVFKNKTWTQLHPAVAPSGRYGEALTYDTTDGKVVFFGGTNSTLGVALSDTWTFAATNWTKLGPAFHPSSRGAPAATDGPAGSGLVLFGGYSYPLNTELNDSWAFKGNVWKKASPPSPTARVGASMTYDEADGYVLFFGASSAGLPGHETWTFAAGHWTQRHPAVAPTDRSLAMMAYDQADGYVVLFGGAGTHQILNDTWTFLAGVWTHLSTPVAPGPRVDASMAYDAADGYVLLFGGSNASGGALGDTWSFSSGVWTEIYSGTSPAARSGAAVTYDSEDGYVLLFGGVNQPALTEYNDTWSYVGGTWTLQSGAQSSAPLSLDGAGLADDTYDGFPVLFGGQNGTLGFQAQSYAYVGGTWTVIILNGVSFPAFREPVEQMVYDASDSTIVLFGGIGSGLTLYGDTWEFT